jgi:hypothetical protein
MPLLQQNGCMKTSDYYSSTWHAYRHYLHTAITGTPTLFLLNSKGINVQKPATIDGIK